MFKHIKKIISFNNKRKSQSEQDKAEQEYNASLSEDELREVRISRSITKNVDNIKDIIGDNTDLIFRNITVGRSEARPAAIVYIADMIDAVQIDENIVRPLVLDVYTSGLSSGSEIIAQLKAGNVLTKGRIKTVEKLNDFLDAMLVGEVGLLIDGVDESYMINAKGAEHRNITESTIEPVVRGPRESFVENLSVNLGLVRKRIHHRSLTFESLSLGTIDKIEIVMAYIKGICPTGLSDEVRSRIKRINTDTVTGTGFIEELIVDNPYSIFPQVRNTEKPDVVADALMEGRVAIIGDNTPTALIVPGEFFSLMQAPDDYHNRYTFSSMIRLLRYLAFFVSLFLPAFYIAVITYHQEMIPTGLLVSIISSRAEVPVPVFAEAFIMMIIFEILHEAGIRMPRAIGQAVSIVGALVIGQAAVQAKVISPLMVIVVALTAVSKFAVAQYSITLPIRILRFLFMFLASILGMFGIMIGTLFVMLHLFSLESFGKPYMAPLSPFRPGDLKDTAIRAPWWAFVRRPAYSSVDSKRMEPGQIPHPPKKKGNQS